MRYVVHRSADWHPQEPAGAKQRGRTGGAVLWHGSQPGQIALAEWRLVISQPRLRTKGAAFKEVAVPGYERLRSDARVGQRVRDIVVKSVSRRKYGRSGFAAADGAP